MLEDQVLNAELDSADLAVAELYWIQACQRVSVHNKKFEEWTKQFGLYLDDLVGPGSVPWIAHNLHNA